MSEHVARILECMDRLSQPERAELAYAFVCSLEDGVGEAWEAEFLQRVAEIRAGSAIGKPAGQLFDELRG